jgi:hypothetical protein
VFNTTSEHTLIDPICCHHMHAGPDFRSPSEATEAEAEPAVCRRRGGTGAPATLRSHLSRTNHPVPSPQQRSSSDRRSSSYQGRPELPAKVLVCTRTRDNEQLSNACSAGARGCRPCVPDLPDRAAEAEQAMRALPARHSRTAARGLPLPHRA